MYFLSYALPALLDNGQTELAEQVVRETFGLLQRMGAWTIWECFSRGVRGNGSLCHAGAVRHPSCSIATRWVCSLRLV